MKKTLASFLAALMVLSAVVLFPAAAISPVTVSVPVIEVEAGTEYADVWVTISDIPSVGLSSCSFNLKSERLTLTNIENMLDGLSPIGPIGGSNKNGATFMWSDFRSGIRETTQVCRYTFKLPKNARIGDEFPLIITPDSKAGSFSSVDSDPASGKPYDLGASAVNGKIVVVAGKNAVTVQAPELEVEAGTKTVDVPIRITGISPFLGLSSFKFNTVISGFTAVNAAFGPLPGSPRLDPFELSATRGIDIMWIAPTGDGIFEDTTVITYTFEIPKSARAGDVYPIVVTPDGDLSNFLSIDWGQNSNNAVPLGAVGINGQITISGDPDIHEQPGAVTLKAPEIHVDEGTASVDIPVTLTDIPREGLAGCSFNLMAEGLDITGITTDLKGICSIPDSFEDSASKGASFVWSDVGGIRMTSEVCTYRVAIPASAKAGDVFPIIITPNENPASFPSVDANPENGKRYDLGATAVNGRIVIDSTSQYDGPPAVLEAPVITVYENTDTVEVPITLKNIPDIGLRTGKFTTAIDGLTITKAVVSDSIKGKGSYSVEPPLGDTGASSVDMAWVNDRQNSLFNDTTVVTYTVKIPSDARPGDEYPIVIIPSNDRDNFVAGDEAESSVGATAVNGRIVLKAHEHVITAVVQKAATCTEAGSNACYRCSVCKKYFSDANAKNEIAQSQAIIPALGHSWGEWTTTSAASCQKEGSAIRRCQRDSTHTETKVLPVTDHRYTHFDLKAPTCDQSGVKEYWRCEDCRRCFVGFDSVTYPENPQTGGKIVVKAPSYRIAHGSKTELEIPVILSAIGSEGLKSCCFTVEITGGAVIASAKNSVLAGNTMVDKIVTDEYKSSTKMIWATAEQENAIFEETVALTLRVSLPQNAMPGAEYEIRVIPSDDPDNFMSAETETSLGAVGVNGSIAITEKAEIAESETILPALGHSLEFVAAKDATKDADGYIAHYRCTRCGKLYADAEGKEERSAESLAVKYGIPGDADGNGKVNAKDIITVMRAMLGQSPSPFFPDLADVTGDGRINAKDIIGIMRLMLGIK